ncbi:DUF3600 domain-containing protein [Bacillus sp. RD4P76]|uniref:DUF3600 domain-containing protein n=2 Tax=Bacillus suaedaesalsae TaxID=2810349 RepID=A0ABS2DI80_9BACI|nr:DUF3600 domain-containing protein [Bacillus suaedaesalsae]
MNLTNQLRESLQETGSNIHPPTDLKKKVMNNFDNRNKSNIKNKLLTVALVATLVIPTSAFTYQTYIADDFYGSFENMKKHFANVTMESFLLLNAKLTQAKGDLGSDEFSEFKELLNVITEAKLTYGDRYGNINYDAIPLEKEEELKATMMEIQPYFDTLNGNPSSKEVLTSEEYDTYIEALMTFEKIVVQSGLNPSERIKIEDVSIELQEPFQKARDFMEYVNNKKIQ